MDRSRSGANSLAFNPYDDLVPILWFGKQGITWTSLIGLFCDKDDLDAHLS
jgi:hypothetical protein